MDILINLLGSPRDLIGVPYKFARAHPRGLVGNVVVVIVF